MIVGIVQARTADPADDPRLSRASARHQGGSRFGLHWLAHVASGGDRCADLRWSSLGRGILADGSVRLSTSIKPRSYGMAEPGPFSWMNSMRPLWWEWHCCEALSLRCRCERGARSRSSGYLEVRCMMETPSQRVRAFIEAYHAWNAAANESCKSLSPGSTEYEAAMAVAGREYDELVSRFCAPSVVRQGISFGGDPMHHPNCETIESESINGQTAVVRKRHVGLYSFVSDYEYHLVQAAGQWLIGSLLYLDQDGNYECL